MDISEIVGIIAGILTGASLLPQLIKLIKEKKGDDIAISMLAILMAGLIGWVWYGYLTSDYPILFTNSFSIIVNTTIIVLKVYYKRTRG